MGAGARPARLVLRPLPRRAARLVRQRDRRSVRSPAALGAILYLYFRVDIRPESWSAPTSGRRSACSTSRSISSRSGWPCCRPTGSAGGGREPMIPANARRPDLDPRLHRLVELSDRSRPEQHHGLRLVTSSPGSAGSRSPTGRRSRSSTWSRSSWISRCSPSIPSLASSFRNAPRAGCRARDGSCPRCTGTAGRLRQRLERS